VGINSRHTDDEDTKVSIAGSNFKFTNAGDKHVIAGFAGGTLRVADDNNLSLIANMEFGGDSDEDYVAGSKSAICVLSIRYFVLLKSLASRGFFYV